MALIQGKKSRHSRIIIGPKPVVALGLGPSIAACSYIYKIKHFKCDLYTNAIFFLSMQFWPNVTYVIRLTASGK